MKIGVSSYSFQRLMTSGQLTQKQTIKAAKDLGFDGIEFSSIRPEAGYTEREYAKLLAEEAAAQEMPIINFCVPGDCVNRDPDEEITRLKGLVDIAEILGAPSMRHDVMPGYGRYRTFPEALPTLARVCREVTEYAQTKGIRTMVENHGRVFQGSARVEALIAAVNHPNFGLLLDMGNFLCADENPVEACGSVAHLAFHLHAKDFIVKSGAEANPGEGFFATRNGNYLRGTIVGHGNVPVYHCIRIMKNAKYDKYLSIEFEGIEDNLNALRIGLANLKNYCQ